MGPVLGFEITILENNPAFGSLGAVCSRTGMAGGVLALSHVANFGRFLTRFLSDMSRSTHGRKEASRGQGQAGHHRVPWLVCPCGFSHIPDDFLVWGCDRGGEGELGAPLFVLSKDSCPQPPARSWGTSAVPSHSVPRDSDLRLFPALFIFPAPPVFIDHLPTPGGLTAGHRGSQSFPG